MISRFDIPRCKHKKICKREKTLTDIKQSLFMALNGLMDLQRQKQKTQLTKVKYQSIGLRTA